MLLPWKCQRSRPLGIGLVFAVVFYFSIVSKFTYLFAQFCKIDYDRRQCNNGRLADVFIQYMINTVRGITLSEVAMPKNHLGSHNLSTDSCSRTPSYQKRVMKICRNCAFSFELFNYHYEHLCPHL